MTEPRAGLKRGYYLLNTDGGMASDYGRRRSGDPLGHAAIGALLRTPRLVTVAQISKAIGPATHNVAEYRALIEGLKLARDKGVERIRVYMDSELVVDQTACASSILAGGICKTAAPMSFGAEGPVTAAERRPWDREPLTDSGARAAASNVSANG